MKAPEENSTQNELDLLLFEYLEGALSEAQKQDLEDKLGKDLDLQTEMEYWMESVVEQDFYPTEQLEKNLMEIPAKPWYATFYFNVFLGVLLVGMFSFLPLSKKEEVAIEAARLEALTKEEPAIANQEMPFIPIASVSPAPEVTLSSKKAVEMGIAKPVQELPTAHEDYRVLYFPAISSITPESTLAFSESIITTRGPEKVSVTKTRTQSMSRKEARKKIRVAARDRSQSINRKEARKIARMKDKAHQERMARQFMKGKRAYVVPLNTKNF